MKEFQVHALWVLAVVALLDCASCATQPSNDDVFLTKRPTVVLVYGFRASPNTVFEDPSLIAEGTRDFSSASPRARQAAIGQQLRTRIHRKLIDGINALGLPAQPGDPSRPAPAGALMVRGEFWSTSPDNLQIRNIVKFGKDKSTVNTSIYAIGITPSEHLVPLLHLLTDAQASAMPAVMENNTESRASSAARRARAEARAEPVTIDTYRLQVDKLVDESVSQAIASLSQYFVNQGWIGGAQVTAKTF
jgi:hypothetical protein